MTEGKLRFALFGNEYQPRKSASIRTLLTVLATHQAEVFAERTFFEFLQAERGGDVLWKEATRGLRVFDTLDFTPDYAISMGGDGTLLKTADRVGSGNIPIIGVNTGRLGFLADVSPDEIEQFFQALYERRCFIEEHAVISCAAGNALNDIAVLKRDNASMITIHARVNGHSLVTYQADGLIVSTPTGSTAYNLSNGGPIMAPHTGIFCLTPVAPHSLNLRPVVVNDDCVIELTIESRTHNYLVAVDGRSSTQDEQTKVVITKAPYHIRIVRRHEQSYFSTLREKMMWGVDQRE